MELKRKENDVTAKIAKFFNIQSEPNIQRKNPIIIDSDCLTPSNLLKIST